MKNSNKGLVLGLVGGLAVMSQAWAAPPTPVATLGPSHNSSPGQPNPPQVGLTRNSIGNPPGSSANSPANQPQAGLTSSTKPVPAGPAVNSPLNSPLTAPVIASGKPMSPIHLLSQKAWHQMIQIQRNVKAGKLSKAQGKSLQGQVKTVRQQESTYLKQNGDRELTTSQFTELNGQLDTLSKSIPVQ